MLEVRIRQRDYLTINLPKGKESLHILLRDKLDQDLSWFRVHHHSWTSRQYTHIPIHNRVGQDFSPSGTPSLLDFSAPQKSTRLHNELQLYEDGA